MPMRVKLAGILIGQALLLIYYFLIALPSPAYAHPDFPIADKAVEISPGRFIEFPLTVHFHRVVGSLEVISPEVGTVTALLMDDQAFTRYAAGQPSPKLYSSGTTGSARLNFLIACCRVIQLSREYNRELTYTKYHLVIDNTQSSSSVRVKLRASLLHDGLAIIVYGGEPFAVAMVGPFFGAIGLTMAFMIRRVRRAPVAPLPDSRVGRRIMLLSMASLAIFVLACMLALGWAIAGSRAYGGSLIDGLSARAAEVPSRLEFLWSFPVLWMAGVLLWMRGFGKAAAAGSRLLGSIGVIEGAGSLLVGALLAFHYRSIVLPTLFAAIVGLPQIRGGLYLLERSQKRA